MSINISELDSRHFGKDIARAIASPINNAREIDKECRRNNIDLVIVRCDASDNLTVNDLLNRGFENIDTLVWYKKDLKELIPDTDKNIRIINNDDWPAVEKVARLSFTNYNSHYTKIDATKGTEAYVNWATSNKPGTKTLVYDDGWVKGFIVVDHKTNGHLYGVEPCTQGQGMGGKLIIAAMNEFKRSGVDIFSISTQEQNTKSIKVWEKLGFVKGHSLCTFHKWYKEQV